MRAIWNGRVLAESDDIVVCDRRHYFPADALHRECFQDSEHTSVCGWKGTASYYDVVVDGEVNARAAWYYPQTKPAAEHIRGRIGFWKDVEVVE